jgi:hypothetical protein
MPNFFITITLSPDLLKLPIKSQLKHSYRSIQSCFKNSSAVIEFTKQFNVHYHIITDIGYDDMALALDCIKSDYFKYNGLKKLVFGFTKTENILYPEKCNDYIIKDLEKTEGILRKLKLFDKYYNPIPTNNETSMKDININIMNLFKKPPPDYDFSDLDFQLLDSPPYERSYH